VIALPLLVDEEVVGNFSLYAREADFFDDEEVRLLTELAGDISFALRYIAKEEKANYLAYYDVVTGLPNRTLFLEHLSHALHVAGDNAGKFVLVLGDIKRFRMINDTLGRQAGDEVLRQVGAHLLRLIRNPENLARVTSDCFATFLPGFTDPADMSHRIERFTTEILRNPVKIAGRELTLAFAMGMAVFPDDGNDAETLFRNAETALKKAKSGGESYLFYAPEMNARAAESLTLENKLRRALELGQFVLHYQPKVDVRTRALTGLEALIRWQDPELGLVPPAQFIPLMEETGLILDVGQWALRQAVADHRHWTALGLHPPRIAVNASSIQLRQKNFTDTVIDAVSGFGSAEVALDIEITESVMMENLADMTKVLQIIRGLGVHIAMDDFGTGYSSLSYIAKLPINELKIDRSFVIEMAGSEYSRNIVTMVIQLAHTLGLKVVAEGVDEEEQVRILDRLGCDQMQGYLISKPLPPAGIELLLRKSPAP
jgi:diguanylate cyclase (GGDEF)-like protein